MQIHVRLVSLGNRSFPDGEREESDHNERELITDYEAVAAIWIVI